MKATKKLGIFYCRYLLGMIALLFVSNGYSQYTYHIQVEPNYTPKYNLSKLTKEISFTSRYIEDSIFKIKSSEDLSVQDFESIASNQNFSIVNFEKINRPIGSTSSNSYEKACCSIDIDMYDSYGDGWNGGYLTITIDGTSNNYSASGDSSNVSIAYCDGQILEIEYTAGGWFSYENDNSYTISTTAGTLISDGPSPNTGEVFYSNNACSSTSETVKPQDCEGSTLVCSNASFSGNSDGAGDFSDLNSSNDGCLSGENQTSWYYINVGTSGTLAMDIIPSNGSDDYDFAIWGPFTSSTAGANCPPITSPLRCNYVAYPRSWGCGTNTNPTGLAIDNSLPISNDDCTNNSHVRHINATAGDIYILVIDNYSGSSQPFQLNWNGTAGLDCTTVPLPVELVSFTGKNQGDQNMISWNTLSEKNNDYFVLQYSQDGVNWKNIGEVDGAGTTSEKQYYSFVHRDFKIDINYYRLVQVDFDGSKTKHDIISIDNHNDLEIIKRLNTLGQEVDENYRGIIIIYYKNGTIRKYFNN